MLQQTRVDTVVPYFHRFLDRFPDAAACAAASEDEVLGLWQGLGYYRRARFLHAAAKAAQAGFPETVQGLRALPGVGAYTAGAVASIAFGIPAAAVDGNVERVICRVDGFGDDPRRAAGRRHLQARVEAIQDASVASEVTQGLMELGATVCSPQRPDCGACPWRAVCVARHTDRIEALPNLPARKKPVAVQGTAVVVMRGEQVLLARRPPGLLGGLWEPPWQPDPAGETAGVAALLAARVGLPATQDLHPLGQVVHVFTHRRLTLTVWGMAVSTDVPTPVAPGFYEAMAWCPRGVPGVALSKLAHRILGVVGDGESG